MTRHAEMLVAGHFIGGPCDQSVAKAVIRSPYDGSIVGTAAEGDRTTLLAAIDAAHDAFDGWRRTSGADRAAILEEVSRTARSRRSELAELLMLEIGKPITLAEGEVDRLAITFALAAELARAPDGAPVSLAYDPRGTDYTCWVEREPIGVILAIVPYNWPYNLTAHKVAPALAAGNTVVVKPSPLALLSTYALGRLLHECGVPPGVVNFVGAPIPAVQDAARDSRVAMVSFTGSDTVGWNLKASLPPETRCTLELGGDASAIIDADADLAWTIERVTLGAFAYAGQICLSLQHAWIHHSVYDEVIARLTASTTACAFGDPSLRETVSGPLITSAAADRVEIFLSEAVAGGAGLLAGGVRRANVIAPALLEGVPPASRLCTSEVFGPALTVAPFDNLDEAIARVNGSAFAIQTSVFSGNRETMERCWSAIHTGALVLNDHPAVRFDSYPYGGVRRSGFGREGVEAAVVEMTTPKVRVERMRP